MWFSLRRTCPHCSQSTEIYQSRRRGFKEQVLLRLLLLRPLRCYWCHKRFYRSILMSAPAPTVRRYYGAA